MKTHREGAISVRNAPTIIQMISILSAFIDPIFNATRAAYGARKKVNEKLTGIKPIGVAQLIRRSMQVKRQKIKDGCKRAEKNKSNDKT